MRKIEKYYIVKEFMYYYIQKYKLSKGEFCKKCGISKKVFHMIEKNDGNLSIEDIYRVFKFMNIPLKHAFVALDADDLNRWFLISKENL